MNGRGVFWSVALVAAAVLLGTGTVAPGAATGPRVGVTAFLAVLGLTVFAVGNVEWFLRRTARPGDYAGTCPVGQSCPACGAFNYKPRRDCRGCGGPVNEADAAGT